MLMTEEKIMKIEVEHEKEEYESLEKTLDVVDYFIEIFEDDLIKGMGSIVTGEYISKLDLYRVKGIIHGLLTNTKWLLEEEKYKYGY